MFKVGTVEFVMVKDCHIEIKVNAHGYGIISGIVSCSDEEEVMRLMHSEQIEQIVYTNFENKQKILFSGLVERIAIHKEGRLLEAQIVLVGATKQLDVVKKTRAFQDLSMSYGNLLEYMNMAYKNGIIPCVDVEKTMDNLIVQYHETDWEFLKRLASKFHTCLYPNVFMKEMVCYFGLPKLKNNKNIEIIDYCVDCAYSEYREKKENGVEELIEEDCWTYKITTRNAVELAEEINVKGIALWVRSVVISLEMGELIYICELVRKRGLASVSRYNEKIIGASLDAYVMEANADKVKVHISCDAKKELVNGKWFLYSTVFSSPDGTGWYCMPEENDRVRLYFPDEKEENGYIISSVHEDIGNANEYQENARTNPDNKSICTKFGKQIELTPTKIAITNNQGMQIVLDDNAGIQMISDKDIVMESQKTINIVSASDTVSMAALEAIELKQGNSKIMLKDNIIVEGAKFKVQ
ncbi:MAG: hypothetical protein NC412_09915 [Roseburia sp.]|nr:hypothetical protein [Roseburia sp.]MCM1278985.1 hypothetical protein [Robinsoniella sp.]